MGKLRSRAYRTRTGILPAPPVPKTMTSQRISRIARIKICLCTWTHTCGQRRYEGKPTAPPQELAQSDCSTPAQGLSEAITTAQEQGPGQTPALPPPTSVWPARQRGLPGPVCWERAGTAGHQPQRSLPSLPTVLPVPRARYSHHSVRAC